MKASRAPTAQLLGIHPTRRKLPESLQFRMIALALVISIPLITATTVLITAQARRSLSEAANRTLSTANASVSQALTLWLDYNTRALSTFVANPDVAAMNAGWQKPLLTKMVETYPDWTLASTVGVNGVNVARSDAEPFDSVRDRYWFQNALRGAPITYETLLVPGEKRPVLVVSMPVLAPDGTVVGVGMFSARLDQLFDWVEGVSPGRSGSALVIDQRNIMVAHSNPRSMVLANMSGHPAVKALHSGAYGAFSFTDNKGERSRAFISLLPNGWGVIVLQTETGLFEPIQRFQNLTAGILLIGVALLSLFTWSTIRKALSPVGDLMETAAAISRGDLNRRAREGRNDELGMLARSFNQMTGQLQELVSGLETRVLERTKALERRVNHLQATADVARAAAAIHETEDLLVTVTELISNHFSFDHTGIFLVEQPRQTGQAIPELVRPGFAVLRAASSEGGHKMLERGHRLQIGREGIVGYVAATGKPRIALDVGSDAVFFDNPDLPLTQSEAALPLKIQNRVIGVLDVQSNQPFAFSEEDISTLQVLADQLALAIENTRLFSESQQVIQELEAQFGKQVQTGWLRRIGHQPFACTLTPAGHVRTSSGQTAASLSGQDGMTIPEKEIVVPIDLRGRRIGLLRLRRASESANWSEDEKDLVKVAANQLALSIENARLMDEIRSRAHEEEQINQIITRTQSALSLDRVLQTAVEEIGKRLPVARVQIRLGGKSSDQTDLGGRPVLAAPQPNGSKVPGNGAKGPISMQGSRE